MKKMMMLVAAAALAGTFTLTGAGSVEAKTGKVAYAYATSTSRFCMITYDTGTSWGSLPKDICYYKIPTTNDYYNSMWDNCVEGAGSGNTVVAYGTSEANCNGGTDYAYTITSLHLMGPGK